MPKVKTKRMRNILLATDFSSNAHIAALFAAELTRLVGARLVVFHALSPIAKYDFDEDLKPEFRSLEEAAQQKLDTLAHELHNKFRISVSRLLKPGFAEDEIPFIAENLRSELVVMGAHGESFRSGKALGSVATELMKNPEIPVICVPAESLWNVTQQISWVLNSTTPMSNKVGLQLLSELNVRFNS